MQKLPEILIYDFDGVIVNSNKIKEQVFFNTVLSEFNSEIATKFLLYHRANIHVNRYDKFKYLFTNILKREIDLPCYQKLLHNLSFTLKHEMVNYEVNTDILKVRNFFSNSIFYIASGNNQDELIDFLKKSNLISIFDGGVYGSPTPKLKIIQTIISLNADNKGILFVGDTYDDYLISVKTNIPFVFMSKWSSNYELNKIKKQHSIVMINKLSQITKNSFNIKHKYELFK